MAASTRIIIWFTIFIRFFFSVHRKEPVTIFFPDNFYFWLATKSLQTHYPSLPFPHNVWTCFVQCKTRKTIDYLWKKGFKVNTAAGSRPTDGALVGGKTTFIVHLYRRRSLFVSDNFINNLLRFILNKEIQLTVWHIIN